MYRNIFNPNCDHSESITGTYEWRGRTFCSECCLHGNFIQDLNGVFTCTKCFLVSNTPSFYCQGYVDEGEGCLPQTYRPEPKEDKRSDHNVVKNNNDDDIKIRNIVIKYLDNPENLDNSDSDSDYGYYDSDGNYGSYSLEEVIKRKVKKYKKKHEKKVKPVTSQNCKILKDFLKYEYPKDVTEKCVLIYNDFITNHGKTIRGKNKVVIIVGCFYYAHKVLSKSFNVSNEILKFEVLQKDVEKSIKTIGTTCSKNVLM